MIASKSIRRIWILVFEIVVGIMIGVIASNAMAAQVTLAWDPNTDSDLAGYRIHYGTVSGSYTVHTDVHKVTSYTVTGLTAGQSYYFAATAYDAAGNESGYSNPVSYAIPGNGAPSAPAVPTGPASALVNASASFSTSASDPNGDANLQYRYDWGGGVLSSYGAANQSHSWAAAGQYAVKAQARDSLGLESVWSAAKAITITLNATSNAVPTANAGADQTVNSGAVVSLKGSGSDADDGIAAYQWRQTSGTTVALTGAQTTQASFTAPNIASGSAGLVFELKVTDRGGNSATDTATVAVTAVPSAGQATYSIWDNSATPSTVSASDSQAVELGMKFRAEVSGFVTGVRFYKSTANTGSHVGNLWSRDGKLLSSVVFSNETASGWQEAAFAAPVAVAANTTYVISYHTNTGHYASNQGYFASATSKSPLRALANGEDGSNGVYKYGASAFPSQTWSSSNYWVDVVFKTSSQSPRLRPRLRLTAYGAAPQRRAPCPHPIPRQWSWA